MNNQLKVLLENIIPLTEARDHFSQIVSEVQKDKLYVLTKGGKPAVAIIDVKYLETITGGEIREEHIQEEIKKAPEKVGLPPMVEHKIDTPPPPPIMPPPKIETPKPASPDASQGGPITPTPPKTEPPARNASPSDAGGPKPEPAGFAAPQSPKEGPSGPPASNLSTQNTPTPPAKASEPPKGAPSGSASGEKIDVQFFQEPPPMSKDQSKNALNSPDDNNPPAQYAGPEESSPGGKEDATIDDMSID